MGPVQTTVNLSKLASAVNIDGEVLVIYSLVGTVCPYVLDGFAERIAQCGVFLANRKASTYALTLDIVKRVSKKIKVLAYIKD
jgi:hypothetical protein